MIGKLLGATLIAGAVLTAVPAQADEPFMVCPSGNTGVANTVTSCPFADSVRLAYIAQGAGEVIAHSSVTGEVYGMWCMPGLQVRTLSWPYSARAVRCSGGNNAVVWLF
jgi:hypothetical protein